MNFTGTSVLQPFLRRLTLHSKLTGEQQATILGLPTHVSQVRAHVEIVGVGERVSHACLVLDGLIGRVHESKEGRRQISALCITGDMCDLDSVVCPKIAFALEALTASTIAKVPHAELRVIAHRYPDIAEAFWRDAVLEGAITSEWVANRGRPALAGMAHLLCELAMRHGHTGERARFSFPFPVSQAQMGEMLGVTAVHVNRTVKALREKRAASIDHGTVQVLDWRKLVDIGEFDPTYLQLTASRIKTRAPNGGVRAN